MQPKKLYVWSCLIHCKTLKKQLQNVQEQQKKQSSVFFWRGGVALSTWHRLFQQSTIAMEIFSWSHLKNGWKKSGVLCEAIASSSAWLGWTAVVSSQGVTSWNSFHQGGWLQPMVNWWCGFLGSLWKGVLLKGDPFESQITTGPQTTN